MNSNSTTYTLFLQSPLTCIGIMISTWRRVGWERRLLEDASNHLSLHLTTPSLRVIVEQHWHEIFVIHKPQCTDELSSYNHQLSPLIAAFETRCKSPWLCFPCEYLNYSNTISLLPFLWNHHHFREKWVFHTSHSQLHLLLLRQEHQHTCTFFNHA